MVDIQIGYVTAAGDSLGEARTLRHHLGLAALEGWDADAGRAVLDYARTRVVRPQVVRTGLRGPAADQAESTGWATAWEVLRNPATARAVSPWGVVTTAVRRAVLGELVATSYGTGVRNAWRLHAQFASSSGRGRPLSLSELTERGWEPVAPAEERTGRLRLAAVVDAMVAVGWPRTQAWQAVDWAVSMAGPAAHGWRSLAVRTGMPAWRARRVLAFLLGEDGWPGVLERILDSGIDALERPDVLAALRATVRSSHRSPAAAARAVHGAQRCAS